MLVENVLVAVSGGSDSLALLDILYNKKEYNLIVAHVNYHYRDTSNRDEEIVKDYCLKRKIEYYILSLDSKGNKEGNFEDWARVKRYKFFKEIYDKKDCKCLFVGHHKDDFIETYLMQKNRNSIVEYYGLIKENNIQGMRVIRPLLNYSKAQLEEYCKERNIEYGIDETNFDLKYSRNKLRHEVVSKMKEEEKDKIVKEVNEINKEREKHLLLIKEKKNLCLVKKNIIDLNIFNKYSYEIKKEIIYYFLIDNIYKKISIKESRLNDILKKINSDKPNIVLAQYDELSLYKEYDFLIMEKNNQEYCYIIEDSCNKRLSERFEVSDNGKKLERVLVNKEQFPLYIKNYDGSNAKINRVFIDKKIPFRKRKNWPVVVDKFGALLLVINIKKFYNDFAGLDKDFVELYIKESKGE